MTTSRYQSVFDLPPTSELGGQECCGSELRIAARRGHLACVQRIVQADLDAAAHIGCKDESALSTAAHAGHAEVVRELLLHDSVRNTASLISLRSENHPLLCGLLSGSPEVLELLLSTQFAEQMQGTVYLQAPNYACGSEQVSDEAPWGPLCLVGCLLNMRPVPEHIESLLLMLLQSGFAANSLGGITMPPLLLALLIGFDESRADQVSLLVRGLLEHGADPVCLYWSRIKYGREKLAPSPLVLSLDLDCWQATTHMLQFVACPPLSILVESDLENRLTAGDYTYFVPLLSRYGWVHGTTWLASVIHKIKLLVQQGEIAWDDNFKQLDSPCSLQQLARFSVRRLYEQSAKHCGSTLPDEIQQDKNLPPGLKPFMQLQ